MGLPLSITACRAQLEQAGAGFEFGNLLGGHFHGFAGARVLGGAGFAFHNAEGTKANQGHFLAFAQLLLDDVKAGIHGLFGGYFGHAGFLGQGIHKFGSVHNVMV